MKITVHPNPDLRKDLMEALYAINRASRNFITGQKAERTQLAIEELRDAICDELEID